jgi:Protein of unknown function (DUF1318)
VAQNQIVRLLLLQGPRAFLLSLVALSACTEAPDLSEIDRIRPEIAARQATIAQMKSEGICSESSTGTLVRSANASRVVTVAEREIIETENRDRELVFDAVARAYGMGSSDIKSLFYELQKGR